jgi:DNA-binding response OmpR family regulator
MRTPSVILIDDDQDDLEIIKETILTIDKSILCISFIYPEEALRVVSKELIFVPTHVFIDFNMPRMTGDLLLKELRKMKDLENTTIIMLSTAMSTSMVKSLKDAGANHALKKPHKMEEYEQLISQILNY